jgi:hypothetical protein
MYWKPAGFVVLAALLGASCPGLAGEVPPDACAVPDDLLVVNYPLDRVYDRLKAKEAVTIVVVGSTSSAGHGPRAPFKTFPRLLEGELAGRLPAARFNVVSKAAPGLTAAMVADQLPVSAIAAHPDLVVWEAGTTDAVREVDVNEFGDAVTAGLRRLHQHGIDAILVDVQYSPQTSALYNFQPYLDYLWRIGEAEDANVLHRYDIMRYFVDEGRFDPGVTKPEDQARNATFVHTCLARLLGRMILTAAQQP